MKKILLPICLLIVGVVSANAQKFSLGARGGLNFANISSTGGGTTISYSIRTSILLGGYANFMIKDNMGVQAELFYNSVGAVDKTGNQTGTIKLSYVAIPVFFRYNFTDMFHVMAGPQLGILASAKYTQGSVTTDVKSNFQAADISGVIAFGADFGPFNAGLRYSSSLTNIANISGETDRNNVISMVVGYKFIGK